ncbi:serine hydrolase [Xanthomonadaceae bacterium JHOS43]|nr:serine hydrolase [Xanthomonadaceae bacterium JHOS43]
MILRPLFWCLCAAALLGPGRPAAAQSEAAPCTAGGKEVFRGHATNPCPAHASFADTFSKILSEDAIPGGAYAIVRDGVIAESGAFGVRRLGETSAVNPDTVFRIASLSKTFAAQIGAQLETEGKLRWDTPVTRHVPGFRLKQPDQAGRLQLQHLLGQSTGIVPNAYDNLIENDLPLARILPQFATLEPICRPGDCYTYQNILFSLVEPAYVEASGRDYASLLRERLFDPLQMTRTSVGLAAFNAASDRAEPHVRRNGVWQAVAVAPGYYRVAPAAGINASANDMARWLMAQMGSHPGVVTSTQVAMLTQKRIATPRELRRYRWKELLTDAHYGLGWRIYTLGGEDIVMHSGWVQGFVADIGYSPDRRIGLVVLLNGESRTISDLTTAFWSRELGIVPGASAKDR